DELVRACGYGHFNRRHDQGSFGDRSARLTMLPRIVLAGCPILANQPVDDFAVLGVHADPEAGVTTGERLECVSRPSASNPEPTIRVARQSRRPRGGATGREPWESKALNLESPHPRLDDQPPGGNGS